MASRVFYASGAGPGGGDAAAGTAGRPRQQQYAPRRSVEPEGGRERRPPQQLYVPPRHRQGGASSGFNRASSPGLSTRSEIVTSWRVHATSPPPRCASPGPLSPGSARPPAGPRRRLSHQASWDSSGGGGGGGGAWRQSGESLSQSRPSSRQSSVEPGGGSPRKRSGRRRRRSGRRSRSKSEDRPASAAEPMSPEQTAPWRHGHRDSWDGGQPAPTARPPSPRGPARPRFQQVYVPPPRRSQESPAPAAAAPPRAPPDWPSTARQAPATGRGRGGHTPQRVASPAPVYGDHRPGPAPTPPSGDGPGSTASLGRRGSRRRRRTRDGPSDGGGGSAAQSPAPDRRRSVSPTDLIASLQLESGGAPAPGEPQSPTDVMLHLGVRPSAPLPRTDSLGQLVNTTDDEKVTLGGGRGRGRGRTPRQPGPPGGPAVYLPQSDEVKAAALRRPHSAQAKDRWADAELNAGPLSPSIIMSGTRVAVTPTKPVFDTTPRHQDAVIRQSPGRGEQRHVSARPHEPQQQQSQQSSPRPAVSQPAISQPHVSQPAVSQSTVPQSLAVTSPPSLSSAAAAVISERSPAAPAPAPAPAPTPVPAPAAVSAEERTPSAVQSPSAVVSPPPPPPPPSDPAPASPAREPDPCYVPVATDPPTSTADHSSEAAAAATTQPQPPSSYSPTPPPETETTTAASPEREASDSVPIPERTRRRSASFSGLFNQSLDEPFNWADEVEEWEKRFNDEGDEAAADARDKTRRSSVEKRPSGSGSGGGGGSRSRQQDRPDADIDDRCSDPSLPAHVIELYGFPPGFSKQDFNVVFADFAASGFDVRPVDDRTALGVFSSAACASQALRLRHPMLLSRPLAQASARARQKAAQPANVQLPHRARPETSALHAGRMVASALGVRAPSDGRARQRRDNERRKLKDAKDKKRLTNKQRDDAWEGRF